MRITVRQYYDRFLEIADAFRQDQLTRQELLELHQENHRRFFNYREQQNRRKV